MGEPHKHGLGCGHTFYRGHWCNTPGINPKWTPVETWLHGYHTALRAFRRDIRKGGERSARQKQRISWSDGK